MASIHCTVCGHAGLEQSLSFGLQPLSTRFAVKPDAQAPAARRALSLGHCKQCLAIQLVDRFPVSMLQGKAPALRFREPSAHLPDVVDTLRSLGMVNPHSRLAGLSYIDVDLLDLLQAQGCSAPIRLEHPQPPAGAAEPGLETLQSFFSDTAHIDQWVRQHGLVDLVCARFILEHAESALAFLQALKRAVKPGGYILVEVPDVTKMLAFENHALVWEDHFTYFTSGTLSTLASLAGCSVVSLKSYPYAYEDAMVAILQVGQASQPAEVTVPARPVDSVNPAQELEDFNRSFMAARLALRQNLQAVRQGGGKIAVFGAGHHAVKYINFYGLSDLIEFVADDNPVKGGMYLAGTQLQVKPSSDLAASGVTLCLSSLNPASEASVRRAIPGYFEHGGEIRPIFKTNRGST
jgi:SAM-dependent methyltransferase